MIRLHLLLLTLVTSVSGPVFGQPVEQQEEQPAISEGAEAKSKLPLEQLQTIADVF